MSVPYGLPESNSQTTFVAVTVVGGVLALRKATSGLSTNSARRLYAAPAPVLKANTRTTTCVSVMNCSSGCREWRRLASRNGGYALVEENACCEGGTIVSSSHRLL